MSHSSRCLNCLWCFSNSSSSNYGWRLIKLPQFEPPTQPEWLTASAVKHHFQHLSSSAWWWARELSCVLPFRVQLMRIATSHIRQQHHHPVPRSLGELGGRLACWQMERHSSFHHPTSTQWMRVLDIISVESSLITNCAFLLSSLE